MTVLYDALATLFGAAALIVCAVVTVGLLAGAYFETSAIIVRHRQRVRLRRPPYDWQLRD